MYSLTRTHTSSTNASPRSSVASIMAIGQQNEHYNSRRSSINSVACQAALPAHPPKPNPADDSGVIPRIESPSAQQDTSLTPDDEFDVATLQPLIALNILARSIQSLVNQMGDIPPTPPISIPSTPLPSHVRDDFITSPSRPATPPSAVSSHDIHAPTFKTVQMGSPEATFAEPTAVGAGAQTIRAQREAVARKFFSKKPPPISVHDYLLRLHRYCPMSTGVYLAAGVYIHKLALEDRTVPVSLRTVHRLLLATLRVAMKALEDLSYPHARFAGVGGVSEKELAKLEISVCFLMDFNLRVDNDLLYLKNRLLLSFSSNAPRLAPEQLRMTIRETPRQVVEAV